MSKKDADHFQAIQSKLDLHLCREGGHTLTVGQESSKKDRKELVFVAINMSWRDSIPNQEIELRTIEQSTCSVQDFLPWIRSVYRDFFRKSFYDATVYFLETEVNLFAQQNLQKNQDGNIEPLSFDSLDIFRRHHSGNCVAFVLYLVETFKPTSI